MQNVQTLTLAELEKKKLKEIFQTVLSKHIALTVQLPGGDEVIIQPKTPLKPLHVLKGYIPEGWKEAIYNDPQ